MTSPTSQNCGPEDFWPNRKQGLSISPPWQRIVAALVFWLAMFVLPGVSLANSDPSGLQDDKVQTTAQRVLSDPEFRHLTHKTEKINDADLPEWFQKFLKWLVSWFESEPSRSSDSAFAGLASLLSYLAVAAVVAIVVFLIVSLLKKVGPLGIDRPAELFSETEEINPLTPPGEFPTAFYEQRAMQFATDGNFRAAIRELVLGGMSWAERTGRIRYRRGLTNRDYVRAIWSDHARRLSLMVIVEAFDRVFFGRRLAEQKRFELCLAEFQQSFREPLPG